MINPTFSKINLLIKSFYDSSLDFGANNIDFLLLTNSRSNSSISSIPVSLAYKLDCNLFIYLNFLITVFFISPSLLSILKYCLEYAFETLFFLVEGTFSEQSDYSKSSMVGKLKKVLLPFLGGVLLFNFVFDSNSLCKSSVNASISVPLRNLGYKIFKAYFLNLS